MRLIKFLLFRNKKTSVLGARKYGKTESAEPKEISALAYRQYGKDVDISISKEDDYFKVTVADYYTINEYVEKMREIDEYGIEKLLNNSVVWNGFRQRVNKGNYYIFRHNDKLYNILINDAEISIDERIPVGEETVNKVMTFLDKSYRYFRCEHDKNGSSYDTMYYNPNGFPIKAFEMTREEFLQDFNATMNSLKTFKPIDDILDLKKLDLYLFDKKYKKAL